MPRSIAAICGVPFRKIVKHTQKDLWTSIEILSCGHTMLCRADSNGFCCASQRRCYTCKREGYESPRNRKIRLAQERFNKECEPFLEENQTKKVKK